MKKVGLERSPSAAGSPSGRFCNGYARIIFPMTRQEANG